MSRETRDLAPAVTRAIRVLEVLERSRQPVRLAELASLLELPKSSLHGVCSSLCAGGIVERREDGAYVLGMRLVDLAQARLAQNDLAREFLDYWRAHPAFRDEAAVMSELDGTDVLYLVCRNSAHPLGVTFRVGMRLPAAMTATGKAMLSTLSEDEIDRLYGNRRSLDPLTSRSVKTLAALKRQLAEVRRNGYSVDDGETREGMCSFGAPVLARSGEQAIAGVALSFFRAELDDRRAKRAIAAIRELALELSRHATSMTPRR
jgi:DNA-binding IclR family transcriptional regulator